MLNNKKPGACKACNYTIHVRNEKFKLPYCTYIWQGKAGKDLNGDGDIKNVAANPTAITPTPEYKEEGWCFAYGEEEWVAGGTIMGDDGKIRAKVFSDYRDIAEFDEDQQVACQ